MALEATQESWEGVPEALPLQVQRTLGRIFEGGLIPNEVGVIISYLDDSDGWILKKVHLIEYQVLEICGGDKVRAKQILLGLWSVMPTFLNISNVGDDYV